MLSNQSVVPGPSHIPVLITSLFLSDSSLAEEIELLISIHLCSFGKKSVKPV